MEIKKSTVLWTVIAIMFVFTLYLTFQVASLGNIATGQVIATTTQSASSAMVGGC